MVRVSTVNYFLTVLLSLTGASYLRRASRDPQASVLYFNSNNNSGNTVIAIPVAGDGTLLKQGVTVIPTGGLGGAIVEISTLEPFTPDALNSQNSIIREGEYLFVVNAGSNTVSMLKINSQNPTKLTLVGTPVNTLGDFPVTVAASSEINQVCVANTGATAGVACFSYSPSGITSLGASFTPFILGQENPPRGPPNTVGTTFFNSDATALYTTIKSSAGNALLPGAFVINPVVNGKVTTRSIVSVPAGSNQMFGATNLPNTSDVIVADTGLGALRLAINQKDWTASTISKITIAFEMASCWAVYSYTTNTVFITDGDRNYIYELTVDGTIISSYTFAQNTLYLDPWAAGDFLCSLANNVNGTPAIAVFDIGGGPGTARQVQEYFPVGASVQSQGMAVWTR
ncbi:MAG: hypothetical protein MMC33_008876 [Icmadophila ericetorum]|nr:hypothetical protein [Icmadophila ericetorum]